jgi:CheY-like chemotaxis protein
MHFHFKVVLKPPDYAKSFQNVKDLSSVHKEVNPDVSSSDPSDSNIIERTELRTPSIQSNPEGTVLNIEGPAKLSDELIGVKQVIVIDDDHDSALTVKACLESYKIGDSIGPEFQVIEVTTYTDPVKALTEFKPYRYDLLLVDINMPTVNGYELVEKVTRLDFNIKVCFMSSGEVNYEAIREIRHPSKSFGCFIKKPATKDYLVSRVVQELF